MDKAQATEVVRMLSTLEGAPAGSRREVEARLGIQLLPAPSGNELYDSYEGVLPSGPFEKVSYREPNPAQKSGQQILTLAVRSGVNVSREDLPAARVGPTMRLLPGGDGSMTAVHTVARPDGSTHVMFDHSTHLASVTVDRVVKRA